MVLDFLPGDEGVVRQVMCETEGFDVLLETRRYDPLVPPELVSLQIRLHRHEQFFNLHELWTGDLGDLLATLGPLVHDAVEVKDEPLGEVCHISSGLSRVRFWLSGSCVLDLDQPLSRVLVVVELRPEDIEQRCYFLFRAQTVADRAHCCTTGWEDGDGDDENVNGRKAARLSTAARLVLLQLLALPPSCPSLQSQDVLCAGSSTPRSTPR